MLQIRLSKGPSLDGNGGVTAGKASLVENVTVACPDHLIIADLPVAKSLGFTSSASIVKIVGRRSRRQLGQRIHFCVRCDFPIAVYGRLSPCEHAFCLDCARSESICYLCDERIQKIQTIRMLEGIFICAAPHCLKSFTKRPDFESHINQLHSDLLRSSSSSLDPDQEALTHQPADGAAPNPDPNQTLKPSFSSLLPAPSDHTPPPPPPLLRPLRPLFPFPSSPFHLPDYRPWSHKPPLEPPPSSDETALPQRPAPAFSPFPYYAPPPPDPASASLLGFPPTVALSAGLPRPPSWNSFPFSESMRGQQQQQQQQVRDGKGILAPPVHLFQPPSFSPTPHL